MTFSDNRSDGQREASVGAERRGLDRRQLLKAGAWAAPVVVLAASVPAAAASPSGDFDDYFAWADGGFLEWVPGDRKIQLGNSGLTLTQPGAYSGTMTISVSPDGGTTWTPQWNQPGGPPGETTEVFTATGSQRVEFIFHAAPAPAPLPTPGQYVVTLTIVLSIDGGPQVTVSTPLTVTIS